MAIRSERAAAAPPPAPAAQPNYDPVHRFSAWLARMGRAEATIAAYHADVADLVRAFAPRPVEELLAADLAGYLRERVAADAWAGPTVRRHLHAIRSFYRYLVSDEGLRAPGPAEKLVHARAEPAPPHVLAEREVEAIFAWLQEQSRDGGAAGAAARMDLALYGLCYHAALLVSEAVGLTTDAVAGGSAVMRLDVVGRRGEESRVVIEGDAARWLAAWLAERPRALRREQAAFVFLHPRTRRHTSRQRAWDRLRRIAAAAGLEAATVHSMGPHTLRHSRAAHLAARAVGVAELRSLLRQRSPRHAVKYLRGARASSAAAGAAGRTRPGSAAGRGA